jgi:hypothetical protein
MAGKEKALPEFGSKSYESKRPSGRALKETQAGWPWLDWESSPPQM